MREPANSERDKPDHQERKARGDLTEDDMRRLVDLEARSEDSDQRRGEIRSDFEQLEAEGRVAATVEEATAWARRIQEFANEPIVHDVAVYTTRLAEVVKVADRIRRRLRRRLQGPEFTSSMETQIIADDIVSGLNQCRSILGRELDLHFDLPEKGKEESYRRDRQEWQLSWLASYGPECPPLPPELIVLDDQSPKTISTWVAMQQAQVYSIYKRPKWEDFLTLSDERVLDVGLRNLYAHQRYLYINGEFLKHLNELGLSLLRNRGRISTDHLNVLVHQLQEMHLVTRDARNLFFPFPRVSQDTRED